MKASYSFNFENGTTISYYLDEDGLPYQIVENEKIPLALPLEHLEVKDESKISALNAEKNSFIAYQNSEEQLLPLSTPSVGFDLSDCANDENSRKYTASISNIDTSYFHTPTFKYNTHHNALCIKSKSHSPFWATSKNLNLSYYYYYETTDKWYLYNFINKDCGTLGGFKIGHFPSLFKYGRIDIRAYSDMKSCDIEIWTTPYASVTSNIPIPQ
ncbi:MAG: hypothetical protein ACI4N4_06395 [Candidatus Fimenecus sp.]